MHPPEHEGNPGEQEIFASYENRKSAGPVQSRWLLIVVIAAVIVSGVVLGAKYLPSLVGGLRARTSDTPYARLAARLRPGMTEQQVAEALGTPYVSDFEIDDQRAWVYYAEGSILPFFVVIGPGSDEAAGWCIYAADDKPGETEVQVFAPGGMSESGTMQWISSREKMLPMPARYTLVPTDSDKPGIGTSAPTLYTLRSLGADVSSMTGGYGMVEVKSFNLHFECHGIDENASSSNSRPPVEPPAPPPPPPPPPPPGARFVVPPLAQSPSASLQTGDNFLILDSSDGRHIVVLRDSTVASITKPGESFEKNAASLAGVIYAARNGPVSKEKAAAFSEELIWKADVKRIHRLSEWFGSDLKAPKGWGDAQVVAVFWRTGPQS